MLGPQPWVLAAGPGIADTDGLAGEGGIGDGLAHDGAAARVQGTVDLDHASPCRCGKPFILIVPSGSLHRTGPFVPDTWPSARGHNRCCPARLLAATSVAARRTGTPCLTSSPHLRLAAGGVGVVVDVGLPQVLCLGVGMSLVIMFQGWVIVLVRMRGRHMFPLAAVPEVVHHVRVLVGVNDRVMVVLHVLPLTCCAFGNLL